MTIKAIETRYAGCRFRSRLEARYAVFFDHLKISWEYEYEGFALKSRIWDPSSDAATGYLPDFWLPGLQLHVEVKGEFRTDQDVRRLIDNAAALSAPQGGCGDGNDVVIMGRIPPETGDCLPTRLHMHKGSLQGSAWWGEGNDQHTHGDEIANDASEWGPQIPGWLRPGIGRNTPEDVMRSWLLDGSWACAGNGSYKPDNWIYAGMRLRDAYTAARSARFEHGESG